LEIGGRNRRLVEERASNYACPEVDLLLAAEERLEGARSEATVSSKAFLEEPQRLAWDQQYWPNRKRPVMTK
jgi:hypothetical protein